MRQRDVHRKCESAKQKSDRLMIEALKLMYEARRILNDAKDMVLVEDAILARRMSRVKEKMAKVPQNAVVAPEPHPASGKTYPFQAKWEDQ